MLSSKKRSMTEAEISLPSEEPKIVRVAEKLPEWVSATAIANYVLNDHLVDWLKLYGEDKDPKISAMLQFLFSQGRSFEEKLIDIIRNRIPVIHITSRYRKEIVVRTLNEMKKGTPIIWSAPICSEELEINGLSDLLVRSDYINKLVPNTISPEQETRGCKLHGKFHYLVIDVKFSTLPLRANGINILNKDRYKAYKAQVWMYNQMIGEIQGYTPYIAYIMGRGYNYTSYGTTYKGNSAFDKLGEVDFQGVDKDIPTIVQESVKWVRSLRREGKKWTIENHPELYPNMKIDGDFTDKKKAIACEIGEITQLWYCGIEHREIAISKGVSSWKDSNFTAELIGMKNERAAILNQILQVNRQEVVSFLPLKMKRMNEFVGKMNCEFFVDFEIISGAFDNLSKLPISSPINIIFMISVAWIDMKGMKESVTFCVKELTLEEEGRIMKEFLTLVGNESELYHWSDAEPIQWMAALKRQSEYFTQKDELKDRWTDLLYIFKEEPITVKGCFSYSLKEVCKALIKVGLIEEVWNSETSKGDEAMLKGYQEIISGGTIEKSQVLQDIASYNVSDCFALYEILRFLRTLL